jgi:hypothetical protein
MRTVIAIAAALVAAGLPLGLARAGDDAAPARPAAQTAEPVYQLLGEWRVERTLRLRVAPREGSVEGRAVRTGRFAGCRVARGRTFVRALEFAGHEDGIDRWHGLVALPGESCHRQLRRVVVTQANELVFHVRVPDRAPIRVRRVRPRPRATDPVIGTWERNDAGVVVQLVRGRYVGRARESFLIANGCTVRAGTAVWRMRNAAPQRYDGVTRTFRPPPGCEPAANAASGWRLSADGSRLFRRGPDGSEVEYQRAR